MKRIYRNSRVDIYTRSWGLGVRRVYHNPPFVPPIREQHGPMRVLDAGGTLEAFSAINFDPTKVRHVEIDLGPFRFRVRPRS